MEGSNNFSCRYLMNKSLQTEFKITRVKTNALKFIIVIYDQVIWLDSFVIFHYCEETYFFEYYI